MPQLFTFEARDAATIRDGILRGVRNGLVAQGVASPNVTPGSDFYVWAQAIANELVVAEANAVIRADDLMPDSAEGDALYRIAAIYGLELQPAGGSSGPGALTSSASTSIPTGAELLDSAGLRYRLVTGGTFADGDPLSIEAVDTGSATNHVAGDVLRWQSAPAYADEKVIIGTGGLVNGHDAETDEGLRERLFSHFRTPPRSGNWEHVAELAEESSPAVQKAFVYPAVQGPATVHVAVTAVPTATSKLRDVTLTTMNTTVVPYVQGQLPEHAYVVTTTVTNVLTVVGILLTLPEATTASPPGVGGGWLDGTPWPGLTAGGAPTAVTALTSSSEFTVNAATPPTNGVSRFSWLNRSDWKVYTSRVLTHSGTAGAYVLTLDTPLAGIAVADIIWPACVNGQAYADTLLDHFASMGPGEKTTNVGAIVRGYRRPRPETAWPYGMDSRMLGAIVQSADEVQSALFAYRSDGVTTSYTPTGAVNPQAPALISSPPNQFVADRIGFYRSP